MHDGEGRATIVCRTVSVGSVALGLLYVLGDYPYVRRRPAGRPNKEIPKTCKQ